MALHCAATVIVARAGDAALGLRAGDRVAAVVALAPADGAALAAGLGASHERLLDEPTVLRDLADRYRGETVLLIVGPEGAPTALTGRGEIHLPCRLEVDDDGARPLP